MHEGDLVYKQTASQRKVALTQHIVQMHILKSETCGIILIFCMVDKEAERNYLLTCKVSL